MLAVVAHIARERQAISLCKAVNADYLSLDDGTLTCEGNHRRAWAWLAEHDTEWSVILEDDAQPVDGFTTQLDAALATAGAPVASLYLGRTKPGNCQPPIRTLLTDSDFTHQNPCWISATRLLHCVGVAIRTPLIADMLNHIGQLPASLLPIDEAITHWAITHGHAIAYTWPSLVNHADGPTVIAEHADGQPRTARRRAWQTGTRNSWSSAAATLALPAP